MRQGRLSNSEHPLALGPRLVIVCHTASGGHILDRDVTARFFGVQPLQANNPTFFDVLTRIMADEHRGRWCDLYGGIRLKVTRCAPADRGNGRFIEGEFVRQQKDHVPPIANDEGDLEDQPNPIGHRSAFNYDSHLGILLLETRKEAVSPTRIDQYVRRKINGHKGFHFNPCLTQRGLEMLRDGNARSVSFRVHSPTDLALVEGQNSTIGENLQALSNNFGGPSVEVRVYWPGHERGGRLNAAALRNIFGIGALNQNVFDKLEVKLVDEPHPIDVFSEQIKSTDTLDLRNEVEHNWQTRRAFLERTFTAHLGTLERIYGNGGD